MEPRKPYPHIVRKADVQQAQATFSHPWNPASEITGTRMSQLGGLKRTGVSLARLAPGKESFAYHLHHTEEEWIYILSGTAVATIDGDDYDLQAGDFVAFPAPSVAHNLANRSQRELVYLMGGESHANEVADFPALDRRMVKLEGKVTIYRLSGGEPFGPIE
ncbi:MAG TPA: cupin domain-containing protein [Ramlibacter sp.]|uniref:cupin domain-containing protein n=1 Tax=Ramlibacter sp. TaxID=1917967 RepID=UPI002BDB30F1|nr:cupin domain-containing protein [Ramlibacter sp.]HVZ46247.1 cupin domain-containing protein [Ramlibacter sp.]